MFMENSEKKALIFGRNGQLGFDLCRTFEAGYKVLGFDHKSADVTNAGKVNEIIQAEKPDIIINATAYNKVDLADGEINQALSVNALAPFILAKASAQAGALFVHVSSDYVFDGQKKYYEEIDAPNPVNAYGVSKLCGEQLVKIAAPRYFIVRTSSLFGVKESGQKMNFVDKIASMAKAGQELKVINDQIMSPTYSFDLAGKIKELIEKHPPFGIYHITNEGSCSWFELAEKILGIMSLKNQVLPVTADSFNSKAKRPKMSVLKNSALQKALISPMPTWQDALKRYLLEKYN